MRFQDQRVVVLGGTSGIGFATASAAAAEGASVVVVSSTAARVEAALSALPDSAAGHVVDLHDEQAISALFNELGPIDHLVYTAGGPLQLGPVAATTLEAARAALDLRVWGAYAAVKYATVRRSIVLTSGTAGPRPMAGWTVGAFVCSGMEAITRALAVELAPVRVNIVRPGIVRTDMWDPLPEADRDALYEGAAASLPVGRVGEASDIALAYLHLMENTYATGTVITTDGGGMLV